MSSPSLISFVIPAHNEEALIEQTLRSIRSAADRLHLKFEIIVVDDDSADRTAEIARSCGARVEPVALRKISAVRNAGALAAKGEVIIFVDADTSVTTPLLQKALHVLNRGAVGGGALVSLDCYPVFWSRPFLIGWNMLARFNRWAAGCFMFVRRDAFDAVGGFDERFFVAEEIVLSEALKRRGRFNVLCERSITSSRKTRHYSLFEVIALFNRLTIGGIRARQQREGLDHWYARRDSV